MSRGKEEEEGKVEPCERENIRIECLLEKGKKGRKERKGKERKERERRVKIGDWESSIVGGWSSDTMEGMHSIQ